MVYEYVTYLTKYQRISACYQTDPGTSYSSKGPPKHPDVPRLHNYGPTDRIYIRARLCRFCCLSHRRYSTHSTQKVLGVALHSFHKPCLSNSAKPIFGQKPHSFSPATSPRASGGTNTPSTSNSRCAHAVVPSTCIFKHSSCDRRTSSRRTRSSTVAFRALFSARSRHTGRRCASYVRLGAMRASQLRAPRRCSACPAPSTSRTVSTRARARSCTTLARRSSSQAGSISKRSARPRRQRGHSPTRTCPADAAHTVVVALLFEARTLTFCVDFFFRQCARARVRPSHAVGGPRFDDRRDTDAAPARHQARSGVL